MRIYVHIGMHKTGTTSVQQTFLSNTTVLEALRYRAYVNLPQMNARKPEYFNPSWLRQQVRLAEKDGLRAIIFSAETISTFNSQQLNDFLEPFCDHELILIACFRHWVNFLPSRWAQNCRRRDAQSFPAYLNKLQQHEQTHIDARFDIVIKRLVATNSCIIRLISYNNAAVLDRVLPTTLSAFDLPEEFVNSFADSTQRINARMDTEFTDLVRLFNGVYSLRNALESNELFKALSHSNPVRQFYDFYQQIDLFLQENGALKRQLLDITSDKTEILLSRKNKPISKWEKMAEDVSHGFLFNPHRSKLFTDIQDTKLVCSAVEAEDLPNLVQEKMAAAFTS